MGLSMPSSAGQFNNQYTHHNTGASGLADLIATKILETIRNNPDNQNGVHRDMIIRPVAAATGADPQTVGYDLFIAHQACNTFQALTNFSSWDFCSDVIEGMIRDGYLYTGEDENHILAMDD